MMNTIEECDKHWNAMMELVTSGKDLDPETRKQARAHFENYNKCMGSRTLRREFDPRFLMPLLYPENDHLITGLVGLTLGDGAGEEEPSNNMKLGGGSRKRRTVRRRRNHRSRRVLRKK